MGKIWKQNMTRNLPINFNNKPIMQISLPSAKLPEINLRLDDTHIFQSFPNICANPDINLPDFTEFSQNEIPNLKISQPTQDKAEKYYAQTMMTEILLDI